RAACREDRDRDRAALPGALRRRDGDSAQALRKPRARQSSYAPRAHRVRRPRRPRPPQPPPGGGSLARSHETHARPSLTIEAACSPGQGHFFLAALPFPGNRLFCAETTFLPVLCSSATRALLAIPPPALAATSFSGMPVASTLSAICRVDSSA